jgi:two-component sensor histidine kinase
MYEGHPHEIFKSDEDSDALRLRIDYLELLLLEADHRIANSLHLASAVTAQEVRRVEDPRARAILQVAQQRIEAIADVHRMLLPDRQGGLVALDGYLDELVAGLGRMTAHDGKTLITLHADAVRIEPDLALWIGLILNELVCNACKHARCDATSTTVLIVLNRRGQNLVLEVQDDGPFNIAGSIQVGSGMGGRIVAALTRRLGGEFRYEHGPLGTKAVLLLVGAGR